MSYVDVIYENLFEIDDKNTTNTEKLWQVLYNCKKYILDFIKLRVL